MEEERRPKPPTIEAVFKGRVEQGFDVFRRHFSLDVVDAAEHVSAARLERCQVSPDFLSDFGGRAPGQDTLGIASAAPEYKFPAEPVLQFKRVHGGSPRLDGVEDIDPVLEEVGDKGGAGAAGVVPDPGLRAG